MKTKLFLIVFMFMAIVTLPPATLSNAHVPSVQGNLSPSSTCMVSSTADSGPGTLRHCLQFATSGDSITFDPSVFPPNNPVTITLISALPTISQSYLTIDASNTGAILDGSGTPAGTNGLNITSNGNTVRGLQIVRFPGHGIHISSGAQSNTVGGNRTVGNGPIGQGNLVSSNGSGGITIWDSGTTSNTVSGNLIGTDISGMNALPNGGYWGVGIGGGAQYNRIGGTTPGERNLISGNRGVGYYGNGVEIQGMGTTSNVVIGNYIGTNISGTAALPNNGVGVFLGWGTQWNRVGGSTPGERNIISGNNGDGVNIQGNGTMSNVVSGNYIGLDVSGVLTVPNRTNGVWIGEGSGNVIGGTTAGERNIISGNENGVWLEGQNGISTTYNLIIGNYIGTDATGAYALGNQYNGVGAWQGARYNRIKDNVISGNGNGVYIASSGTVSNTVTGNYIGTDASGTAALGQYWNGVCIRNGAQRNRIGGTASGERNIISGNQNGVQIGGGPGTDENLIIGNYIGIDATGATVLGNVSNGVYIWEQSQYNRVEANVIGGNANGVWLVHTGTMTNAIVGNFIGTDASRLLRFPNWRGVNIGPSTQYNVIGPGNVVAYNENAIRVLGATALYNTITQNSIHDNDDVTGPAIDNVNGGNAELPPPVIAQTTGGNAITGTACAGCVIEVFSDDAEEGRVFEGSTVADGSGNFFFIKPGGFTLLNVTATATDAAGNTSEFSLPTPTVLPAISQVIPNQGMNNVPNEINILGLNFSTGITATLGTTPPTFLTVQFITTTHIRAVVPVSVPVGAYALTVVNPGGGSATLANAYMVFEAANDDLFGYSYELWADPPTLQVGRQGGIGLVIHRQGGKTTLSNVVVRFYQGNPGQGGTVIGNGMIVLMSPNSLASTSKVNWAPPAAGIFDIYAVIDPDNAITETIETNNVVSRTVAVLPSAPDQLAPHVDSFTINDGASATSAHDVTLDATASDNPGGSGVTSLLYLEFEYSLGAGQWISVQSSGWVTYATASTNYPWRLLPVAGMRYMQAWAADRAGNISLYPYRAYINYLPSVDHVEQGQVRVYRQNLATGQALAVRVTPVNGDPDLYVWPPDWPTRPPWVSNLFTGTDEITITAPVSGVYQIEVYGYTAADYQISIGTALPNVYQPFIAEGTVPIKPQRSSPAVAIASVPGEQIALPPATPQWYKIYLPLVLRN